MANQPSWSQLATPDFGDANDLFTKGQEGMENSLKALLKVSQGIQAKDREVKTANINNYINSAKSVEELQSDEFKLGLKGITDAAGNNFDADKTAEKFASQYDVLTKRAQDVLTTQTMQQTYDHNSKFNPLQVAAQENVNAAAKYAQDSRIAIDAFNAANGDPVLEAAAVQRAAELGVTIGDAALKRQTAVLGNQATEQQIAASKAQVNNANNADVRAGEVHAAGAPERNNQARAATAWGNSFDAQNVNPNWTPKEITETTKLGETMIKGMNQSLTKGGITYGDYLDQEARRLGISDADAALYKTMITVESGWNPTVSSGVGAGGIAQLMPDTAKRFNVADRSNPYQSISGGLQYIKYLSDKYKGDPRKIAAAYNTGEGNLDKHGLDTVLSPTWNRKNDTRYNGGTRGYAGASGETGEYVAKTQRMLEAMSKGTSGIKINYPNGLVANGTTTKGSSSGGTTDVRKAWKQTAAADAFDMAEKLNAISTKYAITDSNQGSSKFKNLAELEADSSNQGFGSTSNQFKNLLTVARGGSFKQGFFGGLDKESKSHYDKYASVVGKAFNSLSPKQQVTVMEQTIADLDRGKLVKEQDISSANILEFQNKLANTIDRVKNANKDVAALETKQTYDMYINKVVTTHGVSPEEAMYGLGITPEQYKQASGGGNQRGIGYKTLQQERVKNGEDSILNSINPLLRQGFIAGMTAFGPKAPTSKGSTALANQAQQLQDKRK